MDNNSNNGKEQKGFYVEPKLNCPHIMEAVKVLADDVAKLQPCEVCKHPEENWCCLTCGSRFCSRYVKGHMSEHAEKTKHPIVVSYSDLSFWCYECDSYIAHDYLRPFNSKMQASKFSDLDTGGRFTSHKTKAQMEEINDEPEVLATKVKKLADIIKKSQYTIAFTGAGISTSAGIPDYRGPQGVWTLRALGANRTDPTTPTLSALPTPTHMALVQLQNNNILKFIISQNVDGLHRRSGIESSKIAELHGNMNVENCNKCGKEYLRDFSTCDGASVVGHLTGRKCSRTSVCDGALSDSIINFGENLPLYALSKGVDESDKADVCICLGSSLTVTPAADMPKAVAQKGGELIIVNLQRTPLDKHATLRIYAKVDQVMQLLMKELNLEIPPFVLKRSVKLIRTETNLIIQGVDAENVVMTLFRGITIAFEDKNKNPIKQTVERDMKDPLGFNFQVPQEAEFISLKLYFMGHYNEPCLELLHQTLQKVDTVKQLEVLLEVASQGQWKIIGETVCEKAKGEEGDGMDMDLDEQRFPKIVKDKRHEDHDLHLMKGIYGHGAFRCNGCEEVGMGWVYHCDKCSFDLHPSCVVYSRN